MKSPVLTQLLSRLNDDLLRLHPDAKGLDRDFRTIEYRLEHEGFSFLAKTLPILSDAILHGIETKRFTCPTNFKTIRKGALPRIFSGLLCKVFDSSTGDLLEPIDTEALLTLRQVTMLFKKALATYADDDQLSTEACESFFDVERKVTGIIPDSFRFLIERAASYILPTLEIGLDSLRMKHGPGAVYEPVKGNQKWRLLSKFLFSGSLDSYGYSDLFMSGRMTDHLLPYEIESKRSLSDSLLHSGLGGKSRLFAVPKSSTSKRTITVEPLLNQFVQQGLNEHLRVQIRKCSILSRCLELSDQRLNNNLARIGSITRKYSTIDLKSASDLLSLKLVESVFQHRTHFLSMMLDCRTHEVEYNKTSTIIRKFAGMGNALTFPVQSVCFALVSIAAILDARKEFPYEKNVRRAAGMLRIYGDDIIVPSQYARQVVSGLELAGLIVNKNKSFFDGSFKESCGTDWCAGVEITPVYLKYHPGLISKETRALANYAEAANRMFLRCLYSTAEFLADLVESVTGKLPLVQKCTWSTLWSTLEDKRSAPGLGWITRLGHYSFQRWNKYHHCWTVRSPVITSVERKDVLDGYPALLKFLHTPLLGRGRRHLRSTPIRFKTKILMRWVPA